MRDEVESTTGARNPFDRLTRRMALLLALCSSPVFFLFLYFGDPARGRAAAISAFLLLTTIWLRWDLRNRLAFWGIIVCLVVAHAVLIDRIHWSNTDYPGVVLLPIALPDFVLMYWAVKIVDMLYSRRSGVS